MDFNKRLLVVLISSTFIISSAHAAMSNATAKVVGHKPEFAYTGLIPSKITLGRYLTIDQSELTFTDRDGDTQDTIEYLWKLDGVDTGVKGFEYGITPSEREHLGKRLTWHAIPKTTTGDPKEGDELVVDYGVIYINENVKPIISRLIMTGNLAMGQILSASYEFSPEGGDDNDKSTFKWGHVGSDTASSVETGASVAVSQVVDDYTLTVSDVGEVIELSVQAKNGLGLKGNTQTATSVRLPGGGSGGQVINPLDVDVRITFNPTGTEASNGPNFAGRPVMWTDSLTAKCKAPTAPDTEFIICNTEHYNFQWKMNSGPNGALVDLPGENRNTMMPKDGTQTRRIAVEVTRK